MSKGTILLVDDSATNLHVLLKYLQTSGFETLIAQSGEGALRQVQYAQPDIILLDVMMPGIDGFETCRRLKSDEATRDIPVIFMTALSETFDKLRGFEVGGVDYITKPLQHEEVLARITTHLTIRNLQKELQGKNRELHELNASKDKFFSIIAHDLRAPFAGLLGYTRLAAEGFTDWSPEEMQQMLDGLGKSAETLYALLENLLNWSRLQRGVIEYFPEETNLSAIVERNVDLFAATAEQKRIALHNEIESEASAFADPNMLDTIIRNLLSNALKFTHADCSITVSAMLDDADSTVTIAVADTGMGIPEDDLPKLFRLDTKYSTVGTGGERGTGLGLLLCHDLVKKNRGAMRVESDVGKGTTFSFTLPSMGDSYDDMEED
jgi:signal transduction histidine kinase